uniref:N-acetylneuraminate lyase n=3 Tax=Sus scrofa TaxID=9823 RepID=A0A8D1CPL3_PIG
MESLPSRQCSQHTFGTVAHISKPRTTIYLLLQAPGQMMAKQDGKEPRRWKDRLPQNLGAPRHPGASSEARRRRGAKAVRLCSVSLEPWREKRAPTVRYAAGCGRRGVGRNYSPRGRGRGGHVVRGPGNKERAWAAGAERRRLSSSVWDFVSSSMASPKKKLQGLVAATITPMTEHGLDQIVIHVGALSLKESQELAQHAAKIGADGIAVIAPFFLKPWNKDNLINFLKEVAAAAPALPFYYYHIPALTGVKIRAEELLDGIQDKIPTFQGLKFSDTDLLDFGQCVDQNHQRQFAFLFGVDEQLLSALVMGATGAVGSTYNYLGRKTNQMLEAFERKDFSSALNHQFCIQRFINFVVKLGFGVSQTKAIMTLVSGIPMGPPRLPLQKASREFTDNAKAKLKSLDVLSFTDLKDGNLEAC